MATISVSVYVFPIIMLQRSVLVSSAMESEDKIKNKCIQCIPMPTTKENERDKGTICLFLPTMFLWSIPVVLSLNISWTTINGYINGCHELVSQEQGWIEV